MASLDEFRVPPQNRQLERGENTSLPTLRGLCLSVLGKTENWHKHAALHLRKMLATSLWLPANVKQLLVARDIEYVVLLLCIPTATVYCYYRHRCYYMWMQYLTSAYYCVLLLLLSMQGKLGHRKHQARSPWAELHRESYYYYYY